MWNSIDSITKDKELRVLLSYLLKTDIRTIGSFIDIESMDDLLLRISKANFEKIKYLPNSRLSIFRTNDIGIGYRKNISILDFKVLIGAEKINKDILIKLSYENGNLFSYVNNTDFDNRLLLTDESYIVVKEETNEIYNLIIGKPTAVNNLYYQSQLNNIVSTIDKVSTIEGINRITINEVKDFNFI